MVDLPKAGLCESAGEDAGAEEIAEGRARRRERILTLTSPFLLLLVWEAAVRLGVLDARFFPAPSSILSGFAALAGNGQLFADLRDTLVRTLVGFLLGGIPGIAIGAAMGLSRSVRAFVMPLVVATFPIPKIALLPLIMLMFGLGEVTKYVAVAISVVFIMLINTMAGVMEIEDIYLDVGRNFGAGRWKFFRQIAVPGAMPAIITGIQISLTVGLLVEVAAEFVGARSGVGYLIWESWQTFEVEDMYVGFVLCAVLGLVFQVFVEGLQRLAIPWRRRLR